jgi:hypothetical protein
MNDARLTAAALGGLPADEIAKLREDPAVAAQIDDIAAADRKLAELFAPVWAGEIKAAQAIDSIWTQPLAWDGWPKKVAYGLAASVGLGLVGMAASQLSIGMPGDGFSLLGRENNATFAAVAGSPAPIRMVDGMGLSSDVGRTDDFREVAPTNTTSNFDRTVWGDVQKLSEWKGEAKDAFRRSDQPDPQNPTKKAEDVSGGKVSNYNNVELAGKDGANKTNFKAESEKALEKLKELVLDGRSKSRPDVKAVMSTELSSPAPVLAPLPDIPQPPQSPPPPPPPGPPSPPATAAPPVAKKIIIRSGELDFEVDSFDGSVAAVTQIVNKIHGGFVATVNSDKLPNGKVKGSVVVRVPPESLDGLVLDLRRELAKGGELKGQRVGSEDITKKYTDLESRLRAARTMETRLLEIIKSGKGEIKQLLECEKELGVWRTKIEEIEGELRYYGSLVSLSTLMIAIAEKEIRTAASITETETVSAGIEVEEVEKSYRAVQAVVAELKGRILRAEMKQVSSTQFTASMAFQVAPEQASPMQDRLKQIGVVGRLTIERSQSTDGQPVPVDAKFKRGETRFDLQFYNLAAYPPRETAIVRVAVPDVAKAATTIREAVAKAGGQLLTAAVQEDDRRNVSAQVDFEVKRADESQLKLLLDSLGELIGRQVRREPEGQSTDSKVKYAVTFSSTERISPRETQTLTAEVPDVEATAATVVAAATGPGGKVVDRSSSRDANGRVTARITVDVPLNSAAAIVDAVRGAGTIRSTKSTRDPNAPEGKYAIARVDVTLANEERIIAADNGVWPQVKKGLSFSAGVLLTSVSWVIFGLCVVVPWVLVGWLVMRVMRWLGAKTTVS